MQVESDYLNGWIKSKFLGLITPDSILKRPKPSGQATQKVPQHLPVNRSQRIFDRRKVDPAKITLPWAKQTSSRPPAPLGRQGPRKAGGPQSP